MLSQVFQALFGNDLSLRLDVFQEGALKKLGKKIQSIAQRLGQNAQGKQHHVNIGGSVQVGSDRIKGFAQQV